MFPKTNILFVLLLALLALLAPKADTDGLDVPKLVLVAGVAPNRDLLSPNVVPPLAAPNARVGGFCVPKVLVAEEMPKASVVGVGFAPNRGTNGVLLSVEPNIPVVPKAKVGCTFVACTFVAVPTLVAPNAGVVLFVVSKPGVITLVETLPVMPNVDAGAVVPVCVVEPNNGVVVLPNMPLAVPKDVGGFVWPKIEVPLPNTEGVAVIGVELALALENKLDLGVLPDDDTTLVVGTKIEGAVVVGVLNILAVSDVAPDPDAVPKSGRLLLVVLNMFVFVVVIDVVAKMDVVGVPNCEIVVVDVPNCGTVVVDALNCGTAVVVGTPNVGIALLFIVLKLVVLLAVVAGKAIAVDVVLEVLEAPKRNRGLLVDKVGIEEVADVVPSENVDGLDSPNIGAVVVVFVENELFAIVVIEVLGVKLKDVLVTCDNDVAWLLAACDGFPKVFIFG